MSRIDVYREVTERIVTALENGTVPWRKPWDAAAGMPRSLSTGKPYRGINVFLLGLMPHADPRWGTFRAITEAAVAHARREGREIIEVTDSRNRKTYVEVVDGERVWFSGGVRKGEKATHVILWKPVVRKGEGENDDSSYMLLKSYAVFNAEQAEGLPPLPSREREHTPHEAAESIVNGYSPGPGILIGGPEASYSDSQDMVRCPHPGDFYERDGYYCALFHELVHSTGHAKRLARYEPALFGSDPYAREELVAELGSSMLAGVAGLDCAGGDASAAYIAGWLRALANDHKLVVQAAAQAQKACDLMLGTTFDEEVKQTEESKQLVAF